MRLARRATLRDEAFAKRGQRPQLPLKAIARHPSTKKMMRQ
ncbi:MULTISPECIES: hypothetical protein [unclassified Moorena]|nr:MULTISPECIES: hypothetical protein [unclassified Moorena]